MRSCLFFFAIFLESADFFVILQRNVNDNR